MPSKVVLIQSEGLGRGNDELGMALMANFLRILGDSTDKPVTIVFWNSGVRLVCEGSVVLEHIKKLEGQGVEILACGTCLDYFELKDELQAGKPTTMVDSIRAMMSSDMVCL